jgi:hypothetical protein
LNSAAKKSAIVRRLTSAKKVNKSAATVEEILMNLCHSLAINEKTVFVAQLRKLMLAVDQEDENQKKNGEYVDGATKSGQIALREFTKHSYAVLVDLLPPDDMKKLFRESFGYAVKTQQYSIVSDLIKYSKEKFFPLYVTQDIMDALIIKRQFMLMQTLVRRAMIFKQLVESKTGEAVNGKPVEVYTEKYLKISDFVESFLNNKRSFLRKIEPSKMSLEEQETALKSYFLKMLLHTQAQMDHENVVKLLIVNNLH